MNTENFDLIIIGVTATCVLFVVLFGIAWLLFKLSRCL